MLQGGFDEAGPGQKLGQAIPRPPDVGQPLGSPFVRQAHAHERVFVGRLGAAGANASAELAHVERPRGVVGLRQQHPAGVAPGLGQVAGAAEGFSLVVGRLGGQ